MNKLRKFFSKSVYYFLAYFLGVISTLAIFPAFLALTDFKTIWGSILGSFLGMISAFTLLMVTRWLQKKEKEDEAKSKMVKFMNRYYPTMLECMSDAKFWVEKIEKEKRIAAPSTPFDLSALREIKGPAFEVLGGLWGRMAEQVYIFYNEVNEAITILNLPTPTMNQQERELAGRKRHAEQQFLANIKMVLTYEQNLAENYAKFIKEHELKHAPGSNLPLLDDTYMPKSPKEKE